MITLIDISSVSHQIANANIASQLLQNESKYKHLNKTEQNEMKKSLTLDILNEETAKDISTSLIYKIFKIIKENNSTIEKTKLLFDPRKIWRKEFFQDYKGNRESDLKKNFINSVVKIVLNVTNGIIDSFENIGLEADDLIYHSIKDIRDNEKKQNKQPEEIMVVSSDKDLFQLAFMFEKISFLGKNIKGTSKAKIESPTKLESLMVILWKVIGGDTSDNIPSIRHNIDKDDVSNGTKIKNKRLGEKTLLNRYSNLENDFETLNEALEYIFNDIIEKLDVEKFPEIKDIIIENFNFNNTLINFENMPEMYKSIKFETTVKTEHIDTLFVRNSITKETIELYKSFEEYDTHNILDENNDISIKDKNLIRSFLSKVSEKDYTEFKFNDNFTTLQLMSSLVKMKSIFMVHIKKDTKTIEYFSKINEAINFDTSNEVFKKILSDVSTVKLNNIVKKYTNIENETLNILNGFVK